MKSQQMKGMPTFHSPLSSEMFGLCMFAVIIKRIYIQSYETFENRLMYFTKSDMKTSWVTVFE
jgi:hypothetical protein